MFKKLQGYFVHEVMRGWESVPQHFCSVVSGALCVCVCVSVWVCVSMPHHQPHENNVAAYDSGFAGPSLSPQKHALGSCWHQLSAHFLSLCVWVTEQSDSSGPGRLKGNKCKRKGYKNCVPQKVLKAHLDQRANKCIMRRDCFYSPHTLLPPQSRG